MSQILIISDSHYLRKNELHQFFKQFPHCSTIIHCGDIYPGYQPDEFDNFYICKGNNDYVNLPRIFVYSRNYCENCRDTPVTGDKNRSQLPDGGRIRS